MVIDTRVHYNDDPVGQRRSAHQKGDVKNSTTSEMEYEWYGPVNGQWCGATTKERTWYKYHRSETTHVTATLVTPLSLDTQVELQTI